MTEAIAYFSNELSKYSPCLHRLRNGTLCGIARDWHTTGHYGEKESGPHLGPPLPSQNVLFLKLKQNLKTLITMVLSFFYFHRLTHFHNFTMLLLLLLLLDIYLLYHSFSIFLFKIFFLFWTLLILTYDLFSFTSLESNDQNTKGN
jgi:hypothetical protein